MPHQLQWDPRGCHLRFRGTVTGSEIKEAGDTVYGHEDFDNLRWLIFDFTHADEVTMTIDDVKALAAIDTAAASTNPRIRQAVVSCSETIDVALSFYARHAQELPWVSQGFGSLEEARAWATA